MPLPCLQFHLFQHRIHPKTAACLTFFAATQQLHNYWADLSLKDDFVSIRIMVVGSPMEGGRRL